MRPDEKAAAGMPGVVGEGRLPTEHLAVEGRRTLEVLHVEHQVPELLDLHRPNLLTVERRLG